MSKSTDPCDKPLRGAELAAEVAYLREWGLSDREIAARLGVKLETIRQQDHRRRRRAGAAA